MVRRGEKNCKRKDGCWEDRYKKAQNRKEKIVYKYTYRNEYIEICEKLSTKKHNIIEDSEILFCRRMDELLAAGSNKETSKTIYID
ncbi:hypothetical protein [Enterococcus sp. CWB-B31]|uniref:hypothetical protein n=1 Tax=Enterococcus sp. CWB-B31 TaxID=2885159 RepID=UPI001E4A1BD3|nr:hypothetical protein [Enterococcus sp. CWB-B31]MCB5953437.1 hypothetical protein [Enterococcus sp. CWB-B31]